MKRRELLQISAALGATGIPAALLGGRAAHAAGLSGSGHAASTSDTVQNPLHPPANGPVPVAFLISDGAVVIDFCGPWEVFDQVSVTGRHDAFRPYTVAQTTQPITAGGGMKIVPDFTYETAPAPKIIVIPAQSDPSEATLAWVRRASRDTDVTMSVCTGAFLLAKTGLLNGKAATTHHNAYGDFAMQFPEVQLKRGARFVEAGNMASAGGLSSGIDLALHVVERYYGRAVATRTAYYMEYQGQGWLNPASNETYAKRPVSTAAHPLCPVCDMEVDPGTAPKSVYHGKTLYFCMPAHKHAFDTAPEQFTDGLNI